MTSATDATGKQVLLRYAVINAPNLPPPVEVDSTDPVKNAVQVYQQHPNAIGFYFTSHQAIASAGDTYTTAPVRAGDAPFYHIGRELTPDILARLPIHEDDRAEFAHQFSLGLRIVRTQAAYQIMGKGEVAIDAFAEALRAALAP